MIDYAGPDRRKRSQVAKRLLIAWMIIFSTLVIYALHEQRKQTNDVAAARVAECKRSSNVLTQLLQSSEKASIDQVPPDRRHKIELFYARMLRLASAERC